MTKKPTPVVMNVPVTQRPPGKPIVRQATEADVARTVKTIAAGGGMRLVFDKPLNIEPEEEATFQNIADQIARTSARVKKIPKRRPKITKRKVKAKALEAVGIEKAGIDSWTDMNTYLVTCTEAQAIELLILELSGKARAVYVHRIHGRINKLRAHRERGELLTKCRIQGRV